MIPVDAVIHLATAPVDLRKSFDGLSGVVRDALRHDPTSGDLFIFYNKRRNRIKILFHDVTGYCLLYKRLDDANFWLPVVQDPLASELVISPEEMTALLRGLRREHRKNKVGRNKSKPKVHWIVDRRSDARVCTGSLPGANANLVIQSRRLRAGDHRPPP